MKKAALIVLIVIISCLTTACQTEQIWYRAGSQESTLNTISVKQTDKDHLHVKAECVDGANTGYFEEDFVLIADNLAVTSGRNYRGYDYTVILSFTEEELNIKVKSSESATEAELLWFGNGVTLSGKYSLEQPEFDYHNKVLEKVFQSDLELAQSVEENLGEEEYEIFVKDFGMSTKIYEQSDYYGRTVIRGELYGMGDWCYFYCAPDGYFYGVYNHRYFTNDPIYKNNLPTFLGASY